MLNLINLRVQASQSKIGKRSFLCCRRRRRATASTYRPMMNAQPQFSATKLAAALSKNFVRYGHTKPRHNPNPTTVLPADPRHGEQIWLFNHTKDQHVLYSLEPVMNKQKAFRQIPYNGKKLKPNICRKDYWRPMAVIQFSEGSGDVGRSVYQKLREFRKRHELSWDDHDEYLKLSKHERGRQLNDQKGNSIADMAAVLGGAGKGNRIWQEQPKQSQGEKELAPGKLNDATVFWADARDQAYARAWTINVTHRVGIPTGAGTRAMSESDDANHAEVEVAA